MFVLHDCTAGNTLSVGRLLCRSASQAEAIEQVGIRPDQFLLINVPSKIIVDRVVGRRLDPETGDIYHLTFKPPPAEIVDRLVQVSRPVPLTERSAQSCTAPLILNT